jgi:hypothetical protein
MTNDEAAKTNEDIMRDTIDIKNLLREGKLTNPVARTLLAANRDVLHGLKIGILAKQLGASIDPVYLYDDQRKAAEEEGRKRDAQKH